MLQQSLGLLCADTSIVALAVAGVFVALGDRTLGLVVVDYSHKVLVFVVADSVEHLRQRLAGSLCECGIIKNDRFADRLHLRRLIDESDTDEVFVSTQLLRGLHKIPLARLLCVKRIDKVLQSLVALGDVAGHASGVLNLGQAEHVGVQLVDGGDDLCLLVLERVLRECTANVAVLGADGLAAGDVLAQGGEVVQHIEEADGVIALDVVNVVVRVCA